MSSNMSYTKDLLDEASKVSKRMTRYYNEAKSKLTESERNTLGDYLGINSTLYDKAPAETSEVDEAFSNITRGQKLISDSMYRIKSLQESLPQD